MKIGVLIYTHNRVEDAKINMEIIRNWSLGRDDEIVIIHTYNGDFSWYPKKYIENVLIRRKNLDHQAGASDLIDVGIKAFQSKFPQTEYVIVLASDTWLADEKYLEKVFSEMKEKGLYLASCPWGSLSDDNPWSIGLATDFFIVNIKWTTKSHLFPLNLAGFRKQYGELLDYMNRSLNLERLLAIRFLNCVSKISSVRNIYERRDFALSKLFIMKERMPIHTITKGKYIRKMYWPKIKLLTHHDINEKLALFDKLKPNHRNNKICK